MVIKVYTGIDKSIIWYTSSKTVKGFKVRMRVHADAQLVRTWRVWPHINSSLAGIIITLKLQLSAKVRPLTRSELASLAHSLYIIITFYSYNVSAD